MALHVRFFVRQAAAAAVILAASLFVALPAVAQSDITVMINGTAVDFSPPPIIQAGRVFVPLRHVFETLGASVVYSNGTINATGNDRDISLQIGSNQATVNGQPQTIDVAPFIIGASTYVPLRFVSEALGASVDWDESTHVVSISLAAAPPPQTSNDQGYDQSYNPSDYEYTDQAPPPLPVYEQPYVPAPNYIWQPGYWAWGPFGFFWVPGTWVLAPQPGYLWTPGYWAWNNSRYGWNQGYWALSVGFYGGLNYGGGYSGHGYYGGRWSGGVFQYNTYVTHVNVTIVRNVYVDRTVYVSTAPRASFNGGPHGVVARPLPQELTVAKMRHLPPTAAQLQHIQVAGQDRALLSKVNSGRPPVTAIARPLTPNNPPPKFVPVRPSDRVVPPSHVAPAAPGTVRPEPYRTPTRPGGNLPPDMHRTPEVRVTPEYHAPAVRPPVYNTPEMRPTPEYHAPIVRPPVYRTPEMRPTPEYRAPARPPAYHTPFERPVPTHPAPVRPAPPRPHHTPHARVTPPPPH
jgi:hypothetical protein